MTHYIYLGTIRVDNVFAVNGVVFSRIRTVYCIWDDDANDPAYVGTTFCGTNRVRQHFYAQGVLFDMRKRMDKYSVEFWNVDDTDYRAHETELILKLTPVLNSLHCARKRLRTSRLTERDRELIRNCKALQIEYISRNSIGVTG